LIINTGKVGRDQPPKKVERKKSMNGGEKIG